MDGETHINIYSRGATEIGRWLSNFSYSPIETEDGNFNSVEGYWYWIQTHNDSLRSLHGFSAKKIGKESEIIVTISQEEFKKKIRKAIDLKLKTKPQWVAREVNLPLEHYYDYGGKIVYKEEHNWIVEHIEARVKQLREHYKIDPCH